MDIKDKISSAAREVMRIEIAEAQGNEVFFRGIPDENGVVQEVQVLARGNSYSVPAILKAMRKGEVIIHNHPSGFLYPSDADIEVASIYSNRMDGASYIVNNDVSDIYVIIELFKDENVKIDIAPYFEKTGLLSQTFKGFEYRDEQLHMAKHIEKGLNSEIPVIVEAGTGTGKTLAYLIPSIEWAIKNRKRVVISTNTINLQEQLLNKDIPIAKRVIQGDFKYILVKGRGNYLCNRKYHNLAMGDTSIIEDFSPSQKNQFVEIIKWGNQTEIGDKGELPFEVDNSVWELFQSETDMCSGNKCPYKAECFFLKSREEKKKADILITNHHMYFSDLAIRKEIGFNTEYSILPEYGLVVFDEAHNIEKVARDYFSYEASKYSFTKTMNQIFTTEGKKKNTGALDFILKYIKSAEIDSRGILEREIEEIKLKHKSLYISGREYFNHIIDVFSKGEMGTFTFRAKKEEMENSPFLNTLTDYKDSFLSDYNSYIRKVRELIKELKDEEDTAGHINDFSKYVDRLDGFINNFRFIHDFSDDEFIYWIEVNSRKSNSKLVATPLKIDGELQKNLYLNLKQIIFTSATIAIGSDFSYFKESIGLDKNTLEKVIHSPFDYDRQMKVYIPNDVPNPSEKNFIDDVSEFLKAQLIASKGKAFVLFTSYQMLNYVYYMIREELERNGIQLFIQGMTSRTHLVNMYTAGKNPVLFGTDSFWEGVDIKGNQLSNVIIVKLPFKVPSDPVTEAIIEHITAQGKNSFTEYQVPEAVIKFKQGIGRLIRSKTDSGTITILDNRVVTKRYGRFFIDSIPTKNINVLSKSEILKDIIKELKGGKK
ncbi:helicase C-terminal domain-containing protein [Fusobacterium sp.]|uniref:helicase C-terminal domain-containing protein n=1 Tax=Fusobacterium sp. TaxID=68766 RepID=UPI0026346A5A|nr:helicase C-terminal domain-containing protein [Fusobacterium sp.]